MSWDIRLEQKIICTKCNNEIETGYSIEVGNYTFNVNPMYQKARLSIHDLNNKKCKDVINMINDVYCKMVKNANEYKKLNPPSGWGDYWGALHFLEKIINKCKEYPDSILKVWD